MAFNQISTNQLTHRQDNVEDWIISEAGQWFIGVIDTHNKTIFVVPVNIFEEGGKLNQETLNNMNARGKNRYASGAKGERDGKSASLFGTFIGGNWLEEKTKGTHHTFVAQHYGANPDDCLGFTLIKIAGGTQFCQLKCGSMSLNCKPGYTLNHSFGRATHENKPHTTFNPDGSIAPDGRTGSSQMPDNWRISLMEYLRGAPFAITNIAHSLD